MEKAKAKGESKKMGITCNTFRFQKPGISSSKTNIEKVLFNKESATSLDLKDYPEGNEILGVHFQINQKLSNGHKLRAAVEFYENETGTLLWKGTGVIAQPSEFGFEYFTKYNYYFWIGHLQWEIFRAMNVRIECHMYGYPPLTTQKNWTLTMQVKDSSYVPPDPNTGQTPVTKGKRVEISYTDVSKYITALPGGFTEKFIGGGVSKLIQNKEELISKIQDVLPLGYKLTEVKIESKKLILTFEEKGSVWVVVGIIAAIVAVCIIFGLIVREWKVFDWKKEEAKAIQETEETEQRQDDNTLIKDMVDGEIINNIEDLVRVITLLNEREEEEAVAEKGFFDEFKEILMFAFLMVIVIMLLQKTKIGGK